MRPIVYLSGPILNCTHGEACGWREDAAKWLLARGIASSSPMRSKDHLKQFPKLADDQPGYLEALQSLPTTTRGGIFTRDKMDVMNCTLMFVNLIGAVDQSIGTTAEITMCHMLHKPMVLCMEPEGNVHDHPFITEPCRVWAHTVEQGLQAVADILEPYVAAGT